jgi:hypothetical protein
MAATIIPIPIVLAQGAMPIGLAIFQLVGIVVIVVWFAWQARKDLRRYDAKEHYKLDRYNKELTELLNKTTKGLDDKASFDRWAANTAKSVDAAFKDKHD